MQIKAVANGSVIYEVSALVITDAGSAISAGGNVNDMANRGGDFAGAHWPEEIFVSDTVYTESGDDSIRLGAGINSPFLRSDESGPLTGGRWSLIA